MFKSVTQKILFAGLFQEKPKDLFQECLKGLYLPYNHHFIILILNSKKIISIMMVIKASHLHHQHVAIIIIVVIITSITKILKIIKMTF